MEYCVSAPKDCVPVLPSERVYCIVAPFWPAATMKFWLGTPYRVDVVAGYIGKASSFPLWNARIGLSDSILAASPDVMSLCMQLPLESIVPDQT